LPYSIAPSVQKPSEQLADLLSGKVAWRDAPEAIRSWAQLEIYGAAKQVLAVNDKAKRRKMLDRIPAAIRPKVEAEVIRLHRLR